MADAERAVGPPSDDEVAAAWDEVVGAGDPAQILAWLVATAATPRAIGGWARASIVLAAAARAGRFERGSAGDLSVRARLALRRRDLRARAEAFASLARLAVRCAGTFGAAALDAIAPCSVRRAGLGPHLMDEFARAPIPSMLAEARACARDRGPAIGWELSPFRAQGSAGTPCTASGCARTTPRAPGRGRFLAATRCRHWDPSRWGAHRTEAVGFGCGAGGARGGPEADAGGADERDTARCLRVGRACLLLAEALADTFLVRLAAHEVAIAEGDRCPAAPAAALRAAAAAARDANAALDALERAGIARAVALGRFDEACDALERAPFAFERDVATEALRCAASALVGAPAPLGRVIAASDAPGAPPRRRAARVLLGLERFRREFAREGGGGVPRRSNVRRAGQRRRRRR